MSIGAGSSIEAGLVDFIKTYVPLINERVYAFKLPQDAVFPAMTYRRISTGRVLTHDMSSEGLAYPRFQFDIYSADFAEVVGVVGEFHEALMGYKGIMGDGVQVQAALPELEQAEYDADAEVYHAMIDYIIWFREE